MCIHVKLFSLFIGFVSCLQTTAQTNARPSVIVPNGFEVNSYTGNLYHSRTDMKMPGQGLNIDITFSYNASRRSKNWGMGKGWTFTYNMAYTPDSLGIWMERYDGRRDFYKKNGSAYTAPADVYDTLQEYSSGKFSLRTKSGLTYYFDNSTHKRLTKMQDANGNAVTLTYTDSLINTLADAAGHNLAFTWANGSLTEISDNSCAPYRKVAYAYDTAHNLVKAKNPLGDSIVYYYDKTSRIIGYMDERGYKMSVVYNTRSAVSKVVSCITTHTFSYVPAQWKTFVNETVNGQQQITTYQYDTLGRIINKKGNCCGYNVDYTYDAKNNVAARKDGMGTTTQYEYDAKGNVTKETYTDGTTVTYTYEADHNKVAGMKDRMGNTTTYQYDAGGNLTQINKPLSVTEKYRYDAKGNLLMFIGANSDTAAYVYDAAGHQTTMTDAVGGITQTTYDCHGNRLTETDARNNTTTYEYNALNRLVKTTDALGGTTTFTYDGTGNLTATTNALGKTTTYVYDGLGRRTSTITPLGIVTQTVYDQQGNISKMIDGRGNATSYTYNSRKQVLTETDALGKTMSYEYDEAGNRTAMTDKKGNTTRMEYDELYRLKKMTNVAGNNMGYSYDAMGNRVAETDANGNVTQNQYDALQRLIKTTDALGKAMLYTYDGNANRLTEKDKNGNITTYTYDKLNRVKTMTDALGAVTAFTYDVNGNILTETNPLGFVSTKTYDKLNRLLTDANPLNETTAYTYDSAGNAKTVTQSNGNITTNTYDADNRLVMVSDVIGTMATYTYDAAGNKLSEKDGNNNTVTYTYDGLNRQVQQTDALSKSRTYVFDTNNNLLSETDRNGNIKSYTYNSLNRRISETDALGNTTRFTYDPNGNRLSIVDAKGNPTLYTYNALNQLTRETYADNSTKEYTYDANGNRKTRKDNGGVVTTYTYDAANRMTARSYPGGIADVFSYDLAGRRLTANNANATITYTYDNTNRILSETLNSKTTGYAYNTAARTKILNYPSGRVIVETCDTRDRLITIKEASSTIVSFTYDATNRLQQKTFSNGYSENYTYNANNWPITLTCQPGSVLNFAYTYDNEGNRINAIKNHRPTYSEKYTYDNLYQLTGFYTGRLAGQFLSDTTSKNVYAYDALHNRTFSIEDSLTKIYTANRMNAYTNIMTNGASANYVYDANGNTTNDGNRSYTYDNENRLWKIDNGAVEVNIYDALGRRVKTINSSIATNYIYKDHQIVESRNDIDSLQKSFVFGIHVDDVITYNYLSNKYYLLNDQQGSVHLALNASSMVEKYEYSAFGFTSYYDSTHNSISNTAIENEINFHGRNYLFSQLNDFRARVYSPLIGRFYSKDPLSYIDGFNLYEFTKNSPCNYSDYSGTSSIQSNSSFDNALTEWANFLSGYPWLLTNHEYEPVETRICTKNKTDENPCEKSDGKVKCDQSSVYELMKKRKKYMAPTLPYYSEQGLDGEITYLIGPNLFEAVELLFEPALAARSMILRHLFPIKGQGNPVEIKETGDFSIVNYTKFPHVFHPGQIKRHIKEDENGVSVVTTGYGQALLPLIGFINQHSGPLMFKYIVDSNLVEGYNQANGNKN